MILKNVTVIKAQLPDVALLRQQLEQATQEPIGETEFRRYCFVPGPTGELVMDFPGLPPGYALRLRCEEKIIPKDAVATESSKRIDELEAKGEEVTEESAEAIKEAVAVDLCKRAFVKTKYVEAFYHPQSEFLFVNTTTKADVNRFMDTLIQLAGKVKTTTIHISGIKNGVTTRLRTEIQRDHDDESRPFGAFATDDMAKIKRKMEKGEPSEIVTYKGTWLRENDELLHQLHDGFMVEEIGLSYPQVGMTFRLTHNFHFKGIEFDEVEMEDDEDDDHAHAWRMRVLREVEGMVGAVNELCDLMEYEQPVLEDDADDSASDQGEA